MSKRWILSTCRTRNKRWPRTRRTRTADQRLTRSGFKNWRRSERRWELLINNNRDNKVTSQPQLQERPSVRQRSTGTAPHGSLVFTVDCPGVWCPSLPALSTRLTSTWGTSSHSSSGGRTGGARGPCTGELCHTNVLSGHLYLYRTGKTGLFPASFVERIKWLPTQSLILPFCLL